MEWSFPFSLAVFVAAGAGVGVLGYVFTGVVDKLADRTGMGEAFAGGVLLGAVTSLPETAITLTSAAAGNADLAVSNAVGGIAAQTVFLAVADLTYRRANLEHAAASMPNIIYGTLLTGLLLVPLLVAAAPDLVVFGVHPVSPVMLGIYILGLLQIRRAHEHPMWLPRRTRNTREDRPARDDGRPRTAILWLRFALFAPALGLCGWALATAAEGVIAHTGLSSSFVGGVFTALASSLPEGVVAVAAVRQRALTLAVGNVLGGNAFDVLQVPLTDLVMRGERSVYATITDGARFLIALSALMTVVLLFGMLRRQEKGMANIGFEGVVLLVLYTGGMWLLYQL